LHLRAKASNRVDFPDPFSPTKKVIGEINFMLWVCLNTSMLKG
jgi:hypothetical protein